jgi:hypothetical protein
MGMRYGQNTINSADFSTTDVASATNGLAAVTYAGQAGYKHVLSGVGWSYNATPTGGNLKIEDGAGNTVFSIDITAAGPGAFDFPVPLAATAGNDLVITLSAGGSAVVGRVNALGHWVVGG